MEKHLASLPRSQTPPAPASFRLPPWLVQHCTEGGEHLAGSLASPLRIKCCFSIGVGFYFLGSLPGAGRTGEGKQVPTALSRG